MTNSNNIFSVKSVLFGLCAAAFAQILSSHHSYAKDIDFGFPLNCKLNESCFISSYFDLDRRVGFKADYQCGTVTKDNQNGIHISLVNFLNTKLGFSVLSAADGEIVSISQGMPDLVLTADKLPQYKSAPCGNGVLIDHGTGWFTRYCHLKSGSITVNIGDKVNKGEKIGELGSSGRTDWPRLDFSVSRNNYLFDPFSGKTTLENCGGSIRPLWDKEYEYSPFAITDTGYMIGPPNARKAKLGTLSDFEQIPSYTPDLSLWALVLNIRKGDRLVMKITDPNGYILNEIDQTLDFDADQEVIYLYTKKKNILWDEGLYKGHIKLIRREGAQRYVTEKFDDLILYESKRRRP